LEAGGVELTEGVPSGVRGKPDEITAVELEDGRAFSCDLMFSLLGCVPSTKLAKDLGAQCDAKGYVKVDQEGYTTTPGVFCAGDVSGMHTHQVVAAAAEGAEAAQTANYYLYKSFQKNLPDRGKVLVL
jgi:thioredoxin reductase (NADPH)